MARTEGYMLPCAYKKYFGVECPGCGMQRSFIALSKGEVAESLYLFPALLPLAFMLLFLILHLKFKFRNGATWLKWMFLFNALIIVSAFVYKQVQLFSS